MFSEPHGREEGRALPGSSGGNAAQEVGKWAVQGPRPTCTPTPLPTTGAALGRPTPSMPEQGIPEAMEKAQVTAPTDALVTPAPSGMCSSPSRCSWLSPQMHSAQWTPAGVSTPGCIPQRAQGAPSDHRSPVWSTRQARQEKEKGEFAFQENAGDPLQEGVPMGPPGSRLFQAVDPELAECPGGGQPPAHGEGRLSGGKVVLCLRLFGCLGACIPGSGHCSGEGVWCGGEPWHIHFALECAPSSKPPCLRTCFQRSRAGAGTAAPCSRVCSRVCARVCICARMCARVCAHLCAHMCLCVFMCVCARVHAITCVYVLVCGHVCIHMCTLIYVHSHVCSCALMCLLMYVLVHVCSCVSAHVCTHMCVLTCVCVHVCARVCTPMNALVRALLLLTS